MHCINQICLLFSFLAVTNGGLVSIDVPYYECIRNDMNEPKIPGVCATFHSHYQSFEVDELFTHQHIVDICTSDLSTPLSIAMSDSMLDWDLDDCIIYIGNYIKAELDSQHKTKLIELKNDMENVFVELDKITESFGENQWIEGNIWRFHGDDNEQIRNHLANKRRCLLTTLVSGLLNKNSHIAEVGKKLLSGIFLNDFFSD